MRDIRVLLVVVTCLALGCSETGPSGEGTAGTGGGSQGTAGAGGGTGGACMAATTVAACDTRSDCHAVFRDEGTCDCAAPGCCTHFVHCADGDRARCTSGVVLCDALTPDCEGPYVVGYIEGCYEGCVRASECMLTP